MNNLNDLGQQMSWAARLGRNIETDRDVPKAGQGRREGRGQTRTERAVRRKEDDTMCEVEADVFTASLSLGCVPSILTGAGGGRHVAHRSPSDPRAHSQLDALPPRGKHEHETGESWLERRRVKLIPDIMTNAYVIRARLQTHVASIYRHRGFSPVFCCCTCTRQRILTHMCTQRPARQCCALLLTHLI